MEDKKYEKEILSADRLKKQMDFIREADKEKNVFRQTWLTDGSRKENDAEHSWHLAVMAMLLSEYANEEVDVLHVMSMVLIHDLVEIDAGDTYAYDSTGNKTKRARELKAANRLFNILPPDQAKKMRALWDEFEEGATPEAKFANTLDKCQPILLNDASGGKSWKEHTVYDTQIWKRNEKTPDGSEALWTFFKHMLEKNVANGKIKRGQPDEL